MVQTCALGLLLFDMPHSALNNAGKSLESSVENAIAVKTIQKGRDTYPYISAQAWRYWWRNTLQEKAGWQLSPVERDKKIAFTQANPLSYPDDDVFGYMRAEKAESGSNEKGKKEEKTFTRISPLKCSPLMSVVPCRPTPDFGVMARQAGDPVPFESQFYSTMMKGAFSLDLTAVGRFLHQKRSGYQNISEAKMQEYLKAGAINNNGTVELPGEIRKKRAIDTITVLSYLAGGAKQTLYLTDVVPKLGVFALFKGGNHPFMSIVHNKGNQPHLDLEVLKTVCREYHDCLQGKVLVGRAPGFMDEWEEALQGLAAENSEFAYSTLKGAVDQFADMVATFYS